MVGDDEPIPFGERAARVRAGKAKENTAPAPSGNTEFRNMLAELEQLMNDRTGTGNGRRGWKEAVKRYEEALAHGTREDQQRAADEIYRHHPGKRGADAIAGATRRHKTKDNVRRKSMLKIIK